MIRKSWGQRDTKLRYLALEAPVMFLWAKHYFSSTKYFIKNSLDTTNNMIMVGMMVNGIFKFDNPLDDRRPYFFAQHNKS